MSPKPIPTAPPPAGEAGLPGAGGGQTGAVLLSPFIKAGTTSEDSYNHYSLLASIEEFFALGRLGETHLPGHDHLRNRHLHRLALALSERAS